MNEEKGVGGGFGATVGRFANANTFLCKAHHHLSVIVHTCILSNKTQLVRLLWAVSVTHFLCCDCSEDRVALTTVRSPNKSQSPHTSCSFFLPVLCAFFSFLRLQRVTSRDPKSQALFPSSHRLGGVALPLKRGPWAQQKPRGQGQTGCCH